MGYQKKSKVEFSEKKHALLKKLLQEEGVKTSTHQKIKVRKSTENTPLSFAQERLWFMDQFDAGNSVYNITVSVRLKGSLDVSIFESCLDALVKRQEVLRTVFKTVDGKPVQYVTSESKLTLALYDLMNLSEEKQLDEVYRIAREESAKPFDLKAGPLMRVSLLELGDNAHVLLLTMHHIISDEASFAIFFRELSGLYEAAVQKKSADLPILPVQYGDYAVWERDRLLNEGLENQLAYWKEKLKGELPVLQLPVDRPRPKVQTYRGDSDSVMLPADMTAALKKISDREDVTLYMTLMAAFKIALFRYTHQEDIVIGTTIANRSHFETQNLMGFFQNTLVLRSEVNGGLTFTEVLKRVRKTALEAYDHQDVPFEKLVEELQPERELSQHPLFQVAFLFQNTLEARSWRNSLNLSGIDVDPMVVPGNTAKFDLTLAVEELGNELQVGFEYSSDLFNSETISRMLSQFQILLSSIVDDQDRPISNLQLMSEAERETILVEWNNTAAEYPADAMIHQLFEEQAARSPEAPAVSFESEALTYEELDRRANQAAHHLRKKGIKSGTLVGIYMDRSMDMLVSLLGVMKAGATYLPLDPSFPNERLSLMLADSQCEFLLVNNSAHSSIINRQITIIDLSSDAPEIGQESAEAPTNSATAESLAYIIYTSGSTGKPKGVEIQHRAVVNFLMSMQNEPGLNQHDKLISVTTLSFDISVLELFLPLISGAQVIIANRETASNGSALLKMISASGATVMQATPSTWRMLIDAGWEKPLPLKILCGGEPLPQDLAYTLLERGDSLWNMYGPTETTIWSAVQKIEENEKVVIGKPVANTQLYILDQHLQPVPVGMPGDLYIGGDGLAKGYLSRPQLTAEKFIKNPFAPATSDDAANSSDRIYKTGDLARFRSDGTIEFLGRVDQQVKIRGFRIELGEIEAGLVEHPDIEQATVTAAEITAGDKLLIAYLVQANQSALKISELRSFLAGKLPDYMIPASFVFLNEFPLTPNGKIDRAALPAPDFDGGMQQATFVAPRTPVEDILASIWSDVLGIEHVSIHDNFFDLGGHSLKVTQVASRIRDVFEAEISLRHFFETPTIALLAKKIEETRRGDMGLHYTPILSTYPDELPLMSFAQQRLWFLEQLNLENAAYNIPAAFYMTGALNIENLQNSIHMVIRRHQTLRTTFSVEGDQPVQNIASEIPFWLTVEDLSALPESKREGEAVRLIVEAAYHPFNLEEGPLFRAALYKLEDTRHILLLSMHHMISDGWSLEILYREIFECYKSYFEIVAPAPMDLEINYLDYAMWQRHWLMGNVLEKQLNYWKEQLKDLPTLQLPIDTNRPAVPSYRGESLSLDLPAGLTKALKALSSEAGVTLFMTLLGAFQTLLHRYSGQDDIPLGSPVAGRTRSEVEGIIGLFVNTLVLRGDLSGNPTFRTLMKRIYQMCIGGFAHQDMPFEQLVEELQPDRDMSRNPLFQVMFIHQNIDWKNPEVPDLEVNPMVIESKTAKFDLTMAVLETRDTLSLNMEYSIDLFDNATIERMLRHFRTLLEGIIVNPDQPLSDLPLLTGDEKQQMLVEWNQTKASYPDNLCLYELFESQVEKSPDYIAVEFENQSFTYRELNQRVNCLAHFLMSRGVETGKLVGICLERSPDMLVALLAVQKAGGAYVPMDPAYPQERLDFMMEDADLHLVLSQEKVAAELHISKPVISLDTDWAKISLEEDSNPMNVISSDSLAYIIYTSGSTGKPKGVQIEQQALVNFLTSMQKEPGISAEDTLLSVTTLSFDIAALELYLPLITGAKIVIAPRETAADGISLSKLTYSSGATIMQATPATWRMLVDVGWEGSDRLKILCGGEALPGDLAKELLKRSAELWNMYGPTETTIWSSIYKIESADRKISIGRPIQNTQMFVLDQDMQPVPVGAPGELYIGGDGLAAGYLNRLKLTSENFISNPFYEAARHSVNGVAHKGAYTLPTKFFSRRLYKTGDLVRYLPNGNIEFLGRIDQQVKVRGFRIELGEIEAVLSQHPVVDQSLVIVREYDKGDQRLTAYIIINYSDQLRISDLRRFLRRKLPEYMIPADFVILDEYPLTPNGKVDRRQLPVPGGQHLEDDTFEAPKTPAEKFVAKIWQNILGNERISTRDNFFDLGGHSLLAIKVIAQIEKQSGRRITPRDILLQNLGQIAATIDR